MYRQYLARVEILDIAPRAARLEDREPETPEAVETAGRTAITKGPRRREARPDSWFDAVIAGWFGLPTADSTQSRSSARASGR